MSFQDLHRASSSSFLSASPQASVGEQLRSSLSLEIFKIDANVRGIRALVEQIGTARDSSHLTDKRDLTEATRALAQNASKDIKELALQMPQGSARRKVIADLDAALHKFQAAQRLSADRQRTNLGAPTPAHVDTAPGLLVDVSAPQAQTQTLVYATEEDYRDAALLERQTAIREVEQGMAQVSEMFRDLAVLVDAQGVNISHVEQTAERAARDLERGAAELKTAARRQWYARRVCLTLIVWAIGAVVLVSLLLM
ncbi:t-SNARE [Mycena vulgaris]|nr:t-SNARE [Mycena vulgaris]